LQRAKEFFFTDLEEQMKENHREMPARRWPRR
jgi:hypothetical protein